MKNIINTFDGKYDFLSNFYSCDVAYDGLVFKSSEAAFQAAKIKYLDRNDTLEARKKFIPVTASESKRMGRHCDLRSDWELVKDEIMEEIVRDKFTRHSDLRKKIIETGDTVLIEGTKWHDNYWGDCSCEKCKNKPGKNKLGLILMKVREEMRG